MKRLLILSWALLVIGIVLLYWDVPRAQINLPLLGVGGLASGCSQATTVNNALDGSQNTSAVTTLICGLVTDGTYSLLNGLYVAATNSIGNFEVNWANPGTNNLTPHSAVNCTFTANSDIKGDASTCWFDTSFNPSVSGSQNSASMGICYLNNRTTNANYTDGAQSGVFYFIIEPLQVTFQYEVNSAVFPSVTNSAIAGSWIINRVNSTQSEVYKNGSAVSGSPFTDASAGLPTNTVGWLTLNGAGGPVQFSADNHIYMFMGSGLTATQASNIRTRLNTYITTVTGSGSC